MEFHLIIIFSFKTYTNTAYYDNFSVKKGKKSSLQWANAAQPTASLQWNF